MNVARFESLTPRDQRIVTTTYRTLGRALLPHRWVPEVERVEAAYMVLAAIHDELPTDEHPRRAVLHAGRVAVYADPGSIAIGLRIRRYAIRLLLPFMEVRWAR